jgi:hypothetical protein
MKEEDMLNQMKRQGAFGRLGVRACVLDTHLFSGFCQDSRGGRQVATVHANCCQKMSAKVADGAEVAGALGMRQIVEVIRVMRDFASQISFPFRRSPIIPIYYILKAQYGCLKNKVRFFPLYFSYGSCLPRKLFLAH